MTRQPDAAVDEMLTITGDASAVASVILDMAAYLSDQGAEEFTAWLITRYPEARAEVIRETLQGLAAKMSAVLFSAT